MRVLGDAHRPDEAAFFGGTESHGGGDKIGLRDAGDAFDGGRIVLFHHFPHRVIALGLLGDEILVLKSLADDHVDHAIDPGDVAAVVLTQPAMGKGHQIDLARIDDDELGLVEQHRAFDVGGDDRMGLGGVRAGDEDDLGVFQLGDGIRHRARTQGGGQTGNGRGVAQAGAMVDVVGAHHRTHEFLKKIILFIGDARRSQAGKGIGAMLFADLAKAGRGVGDGLLPFHFNQHALFADHRLFEAVWTRCEIQAKAALDAGLAEIGHLVSALDLDQGVVTLAVRPAGLEVQIELAADAAIRAGGLNDLLGVLGPHPLHFPVKLLRRDGADRADLGALATAITFGIDPFGEAGAHRGTDAPVMEIENALALHFVAGLDATLALDALRGVVIQHLRAVIAGLVQVLPDGRKLTILFAEVVAEGQVLQFAFPVLDAADAIIVVIGKSQVEHDAPRRFDLGAEGGDLHAVFGGGGARRHVAGPAFNLHHA